MRDFDPTASEFISSGYLDGSSRKYDPVSIISTVAPSIISGMMGNDAASSASDAQVQSAREANALQKEMFDKQVALQEPFRQGGIAAQNRLMTLLGLGGKPGAAKPGAGGAGTPWQAMGVASPWNANGSPVGGTLSGGLSYNGPAQLPSSNMTTNGPGPMLQAGGQAGGQDVNALRAQLLPKFTKAGEGMVYANSNNGSDTFGYQPAPSTVDEAGLQAAIQAQQSGQGQGGAGGDPNGLNVDSTDPEYGSLMKDFSSADFLAGKDPGYDWRVQQGEQGLARLQAARGGLGSGRALKDAINFNQGQASQEYGAAFNRFQTNRANKLNPLQSLMGAGQTSANQVGQAAGSYANNAGNNITGAGNARAAGIMGGANAMMGGISGASNGYQQNQLMNKIWGPTGGGSYGGGGFGSGSNYGNQDLGQFL